MPFSSQSLKGDTLRTKTSKIFPVDRGRLLALSAVNQRELDEFHDNYVRIGIAIAGVSPANILVVLAQGYCDGMNSLCWSGSIVLEPNMNLFIDLWSSSASTINLSYITEN